MVIAFSDEVCQICAPNAWKSVRDVSTFHTQVLISDVSHFILFQNFAGFTGKTRPLPRYKSFISKIFAKYFYNIYIPRTIFPHYGIGHNFGNWIFQAFSTIFPKYFHIMETVQYSLSLLRVINFNFLFQFLTRYIIQYGEFGNR